MDEDVQSVDSPLIQSNPSTPQAAQVSNPGTPRNDEALSLVTSSSAPSSLLGTASVPPTLAIPILSAPHVPGHNSSGIGGGGGGGGGNNASLLLQVVPPAGGPGCVPQGSSITQSVATAVTRQQPQSKYAQLLAVIEDLGKDIRPTYAGSKSSAERLKRGIVHARILASSESLKKASSTPLVKFDTGYYADSTEWCPQAEHRDLLVCGTYQLMEQQVTKTGQDSKTVGNSRVGCLHLLKLIDESKGVYRIRVLQTCPTSAILDSKWCRHLGANCETLLGVANASGHITIYQLDNETLTVVTDRDISRGNRDCLALSLDWSTGKYSSGQPHIAVSDSSGGVSIVQLGPSGLQEVAHWNAHGHEAWITAFNYWSPTLLYSGGDDCRLKGWDMRQSPKTPCFSSNSHSMGVTSIQSNCWTEHVLATGSYDEHVFLWDVRQMRCPKSDVSVGGGVWRLKWRPDGGHHLLVACMHGGVSIMEHRSSLPPLEPIFKYQGHSSLAYGIDWSFDGTRIASCSFYDHALHIWDNPVTCLEK